MMAITQVGDLGDNTLPGANGQDNVIFGDTDGQLSGQMSTGGHDTLIGGRGGTNTLVGDAGSMVSPVTGGNDTLMAGVGATNTLIGDAISSTGAVPTGGDDRLVSAANSTDNMWGDFQNVNGGPPSFGNDTFVFGPRNGDDVINDFHRFEDMIEIDASQANGPFPTTFAELNIELVDTNADSINDASVVHLGAHNSVTVVGVTGLTADDFNFIL
jgi:hypothetical protein